MSAAERLGVPDYTERNVFVTSVQQRIADEVDKGTLLSADCAFSDSPFDAVGSEMVLELRWPIGPVDSQDAIDLAGWLAERGFSNSPHHDVVVSGHSGSVLQSRHRALLPAGVMPTTVYEMTSTKRRVTWWGESPESRWSGVAQPCGPQEAVEEIDAEDGGEFLAFVWRYFRLYVEPFDDLDEALRHIEIAEEEGSGSGDGVFRRVDSDEWVTVKPLSRDDQQGAKSADEANGESDD